MKNRKSLLSTIAIIMIFFFHSTNSFSQDIIIFTDKSTVVARDISITPEQVTYSNFNNQSDKRIVVQKHEIRSISYKDGTSIYLNTNHKSSKNLALGKNLISFHLLDFIISNITISYERIIADGKYGIQIPISLGYKNEPTSIYYPIPTEPEYTNKLVNTFCTGINFNLYPTGQGRIKYFLGPGIRIGSGLYFDNIDYNYSNHSYMETTYFKLLVNNGLVYSPVESLSISAVFGLGIQYILNKEINKAQTTGTLALNLSLRF